ncbi:MAG: hypothetical protein VXW65_12465 [Pseudomonadota bacterium]|nr:hypothetical protein [Pseudomonadota bacterium]
MTTRSPHLLALACTTSLLLGACSSLPQRLQSPQTAQQSALQAYDRLFTNSRYQFDGRAQVHSLKVGLIDPTAQPRFDDEHQQREQYLADFLAEAVAEAEQSGATLTEDQKSQILQRAMQRYDEQADTATAKTPAQTTPKKPTLIETGLIKDMLISYLKNYRIDYQGVVDLRQQQIAITPSLAYDARNTQMRMDFPMLIDFKQQALYADLGALAYLLTNPAHEGKYTRFDLKSAMNQAKRQLDSKQLYHLIRQSTALHYALAKPDQVRYQPLSGTDKQQGAAQKITLNIPLEQYLTHKAVFFAINKDHIQSLLRDPKAAKNSTPLITVPEVAARLKQQPELYDNMLSAIRMFIQPHSTWQEHLLIDSQQRLQQVNAEIQLSVSSKRANVDLTLHHQIRFSDYGRAKINYSPKPDNWVSFQDTRKGTLFGELANKFGDLTKKRANTAKPSDAETPATPE